MSKRGTVKGMVKVKVVSVVSPPARVLSHSPFVLRSLERQPGQHAPARLKITTCRPISAPAPHSGISLEEAPGQDLVVGAALFETAKIIQARNTSFAICNLVTLKICQGSVLLALDIRLSNQTKHELTCALVRPAARPRASHEQRPGLTDASNKAPQLLFSLKPPRPHSTLTPFPQPPAPPFHRIRITWP